MSVARAKKWRTPEREERARFIAAVREFAGYDVEEHRQFRHYVPWLVPLLTTPAGRETAVAVGVAAVPSGPGLFNGPMALLFCAQDDWLERALP